MKRSGGALMPLLCAVGAMGLLAPVRADDQGVRRTLGALYARFARAQSARETGEIRQFIEQETTPDFVIKGAANSINRQQYLFGLSKLEGHRQAGNVSYKIGKLSVSGAEAVVLATRCDPRTLSNSDPTKHTTGKAHTYNFTRTLRDHWVRTAAGWKLKQREVLGETVTEDGKSPPAPGR